MVQSPYIKKFSHTLVRQKDKNFQSRSKFYMKFYIDFYMIQVVKPYVK